MKISAFGIVSESCPICSELKRRLVRDFATKKIELEFVEVSYDLDPETAIEEAFRFDIKEIPSFVIGDNIFTTNYHWDDILRTVKNLLQ